MGLINQLKNYQIRKYLQLMNQNEMIVYKKVRKYKTEVFISWLISQKNNLKYPRIIRIFNYI